MTKLRMSATMTTPEYLSSPFKRIARALARRGIKIGDGSNIPTLDRLADLVEVACLNAAERQQRQGRFADPYDDNDFPPASNYTVTPSM